MKGKIYLKTLEINLEYNDLISKLEKYKVFEEGLSELINLESLRLNLESSCRDTVFFRFLGSGLKGLNELKFLYLNLSNNNLGENS